MVDPLILDPFDALLEELPVERLLLSASEQVDLTWLTNASVVDFVVRHEPPSSLVAEAIVLIDTAGVQLMELGSVKVMLASPLEGERPLLMRITLGPSAALAIYDLRLAVDLAQPWLHRVDPMTWRRTDAPFRFEVDASLRIATDGSTDCDLFGLSIPPVEIGNTGIIVALDDCRLAVNGSGVPVSLRDLMNATGRGQFDGIYARRARLFWVPQFRFPSANLPGFGFDFRDVLLDDMGISFTLDETWKVERLASAPHRLSPRCAMLGRLFGDRLRIAFEHATGRVVQNQPVGFALDALLEIVPLAALLKAHFQVDYEPQIEGGMIGLALTQEAGSTIDLDLAVGTLKIENFSAEGVLQDQSLEVSGSARFSVDLPGWTSSDLDVEALFSTDGQATSLRVTLPRLGLGPLGQISNTEFCISFAPIEGDTSQVTSFGITLTLEWGDLAERLRFANLPPNLPLPPDDATVTASIHWSADGGLELRIDAAAGDPTTIFAFLPPRFRPEVRSVAFGLRVTYADANDFFGAQPDDSITGEAFARLSFRPALSQALRDNGVIELNAGGEDGFINAELRASIEADGSSQLSLDVASPVALEVALPGVTDGPLLLVALTKASMTLEDNADESGPSVAIQLIGEFGVLPTAISVSSLLSPSIITLLDPLMNVAFRGTITGTLNLNDDRAAFSLSAQINDAEIECDLLDLIGQLAAGLGAAERAEAPAQRNARQELDLDLSLRFALDSLQVQIGELENSFGELLPAAVELHFSAGIAGVNLPAFVKISTEELAIGFDGAEVPLRLPRFPIAPSDLQSLAGPDGLWDAVRFNSVLVLAQLQAELDAGGQRTGRRAMAVRAELLAKLGMLRFIHGVWSEMSSDAARETYQDGITALITVLDSVTGLTHIASDVRLAIGKAQLRLPFDDPRSIAVEGEASITGFDESDPLHGLEGLTLRLGLSPDQIYFGLEASGEPIPLPSVGRYVDGQVSLSQLTIGYGFTRNSLAMSFAGELVYPQQLTEDVDTSRLIGFGIKLPRYNRLAFRLDMIPVPGPIPLVPSFEFALDLRTPGVPALINTQACEPAFDGLELHVPGVVHADIKAISASPLFGILPAINVRFDGDLDLGNDQFGLTIVCDDLLWLAGIGTPPTQFPIMFLFDPMAPYFEHLCVNARCAGFGINFDLERPFPLPNPLLVFEVLALIADPLTPIDPDGVLARSIRIALRDTYISIPRWAQRLIPGGAQFVRNEIDVELNVGTLISAAQWIAGAVPPLLKQADDAFAAGAAALRYFTEHPPRIDPGELLALLPPQLRAFDCELSFAGFDATATIVLITPKDARRRNTAVDDLWQLPALSGFSRQNLTNLPVPPRNVAAVLVAAQIELLNVASYRFFGRLADDGSFALLTGLNIEPLKLSINGVKIALPLQFEGSLLLVGQINDQRRVAEVRAQGTGEWHIVPGVLRVSAGVRRPVKLCLNSNGRFALSGDGEVDFFNGALTIAGELDASESHLAVKGELNFALGGTPRRRSIVALRADGATQIGPGPKWSFDGRGELRLYDLALTNASFRLSERELMVHAAIKRRRWRIGRLQFDTYLERVA